MDRTGFLSQHPEFKRRDAWLTFMAAAWEGTGGFTPLYGAQNISQRGGLPAMPSWWHDENAGSYLLKHEGESTAEWYARIISARYVNHLRRVIGHWLGLLLRRGPTRTAEMPPALAAWIADADGVGTGIDGVLEQAITRALLWGGQPAIIDRPSDPTAPTAADAAGSPYVTLPDPRTLWHWDTDALGRWTWVKFVEAVNEYESATGEMTSYRRATIWTRTDWQRWALPADGDEPVLLAEGPNPLGEVPVVMLCYADPVPPAVFGWTPADELGQLGREDYNDRSRQLEIFERQTFSQLQVPYESGAEKKVQELEIGIARGLGIPKDASRDYKYIAPEAHPMDAHDRKIAASSGDALRVMGLELLMGSTAAPTSGLARQYEFQALNASLARMAKRAAAWERSLWRLVLRWGGMDDGRARQSLEGVSVEWPDDFDIRDRQADLAIAAALLDMPGLDSVSRMAARRQARDLCLQLTDEERAASDEELIALMAAERIMPPPTPGPEERPTEDEASDGEDGEPEDGDDAAPEEQPIV